MSKFQSSKIGPKAEKGEPKNKKNIWGFEGRTKSSIKKRLEIGLGQVGQKLIWNRL